MTDAASAAEDAPNPSPYERTAQIFPKLTEGQLKRAAVFGRCEDLPGGETVFAIGDRTVDFFIVLSGAIEIFDLTPEGERNVFTVHGPSNFTGELDLFSNRRILVSGRMREAGRVLRFNRDEFRKLMIAEPDIGEIIIRAFILRRTGFIEHDQGAVTLIGDRRDADFIRLERFLRRNGHPLRALDPAESAEGRRLAERRGGRGPFVLCADGAALDRPTTFELAARLGILEEVDETEPYDVAVVGAGPAGLASAVYAASEGLRVVVLEGEAPGGQAGTSSKIENYLGFPTGVSGQALAGRAQVQAQKFGATIAVPRRVARLDCEERPFAVALEDGARLRARSVVIASGAGYRKLDLDNYERFEGAGVHYAATALEASLCKGEEAVVVGGGNSAGQAAVYLSRHAAHVHMLVRSDGLAASMSSYLVGRIDASPRITLHTNSEIVALHGAERLERVEWRRGDGGTETRDARNVFVMIGARPNTDWLDGCVALDERGFILAGGERAENWPLRRGPYILETSRPGVFAVGDVRAGSVKRVASGVGEGSVAVQFLHRIVAETEAEGEMDWTALPKVGEPGTAADFQIERLRAWGLEDLAEACVSKEQALLAHHCALYVRTVWTERLGRASEPPPEAVRHCVDALLRRPDMLSRTDRLMSGWFAHDDAPLDLDEDPELLEAVSASLRERGA